MHSPVTRKLCNRPRPRTEIPSIHAAFLRAFTMLFSIPSLLWTFSQLCKSSLNPHEFCSSRNLPHTFDPQVYLLPRLPLQSSIAEIVKDALPEAVPSQEVRLRTDVERRLQALMLRIDCT